MNDLPPPPPPFPVMEGAQGYPPSQFSTTSTPSARLQSQRSRFGFHPPSPYPRPRSSASKPNPGRYFNFTHEESMSDNYPSPDNYYRSPSNDHYPQNQSQNSSFGKPSNDRYTQNQSQNSPFGKPPSDHYPQNQSQNSPFGKPPSDHYPQDQSQNFPYGKSPNDYYPQNQSQNSSFGNPSNDHYPQNQSQNSSFGNQSFNNFLFNEPLRSSSFKEPKLSFSNSVKIPKFSGSRFSNNSLLSQDGDSSYTTCPESSFSGYDYNQSNNVAATTPPQFSNNRGANSPRRGGRGSRDSRRNFRGRSPALYGNSTPKFSPSGELGGQTALDNQTFPATRPMKRKAPASQLLSCEICALTFTSQIPYDMHLNGAKHTKKVKAIETLKLLQAQGHAQPGDSENKVFNCKVCNLQLNGALQVQTHYDGNKHKQKLKILENPELAEAEKQNGKQASEETATIVPKPPEPEPVADDAMDIVPPAKMPKLECDICGVTVNSAVQLQQHLDSKKHLAKVEGRTVPARKGKGKKNKSGLGDEDETNGANNIPRVVNIPDISSNFVKAESNDM